MTATTATDTRRVELCHDEGAAYLPPSHVLIHGHDIDEDAARPIAQAALDEWITEVGDDTPTPRRPMVTTGEQTHVRKVPNPGEGWLQFHFHAKPGRGASPIWLFEVDVHLRPRCDVEGCDRPGWKYGLSIPEGAEVCTQHARMFKVQHEMRVAQRSLHEEWIVGRPEADEYFGKMTTQERRDIALRGIESAATRYADTAQRAAQEMTDLEANGYAWPLTLADGSTYFAWAPFDPATSRLYFFAANEHQAHGTVHAIGASSMQIKAGHHDALCGARITGGSSLNRSEITLDRVCERCTKALGVHAYRLMSGR